MPTTLETIRSFITNNFYVVEPGKLRNEDSLLDTGIVDSTGVLEVIAFLEAEFGIHVDDSEIVPDNLDSIARIEAFVERRMAA